MRVIPEIRKAIVNALLLVAVAGALASCAAEKDTRLVQDPNDKRESTMPWNKQESWELGDQQLARMHESGYARHPLVDRGSLNPKTGRNDCVFRNDHNPVADEIIIAIEIRRFSFRRDDDTVGDSRILIDDRAIDYAIASNPDGGLLFISVSILFEVISAHHNTVANSGATLDGAAHADHTTFQMRV